MTDYRPVVKKERNHTDSGMIEMPGQGIMVFISCKSAPLIRPQK
jgi:hypothetical protein